MTEQKKITTRASKRTEDAPTSSGEEPPSNLLQQAHGWAGVAREAREDCRKGAEAEQEILRRRNESGQ